MMTVLTVILLQHFHILSNFMKKIRIIGDYCADSPVWTYRGDWENGYTGNLKLDDLPLSEELKNELTMFQKWHNDIFNVVNNIRGGDWNNYTNEEFERSRIELNIPVIPNARDIEKKRIELEKKISNELPKNIYELDIKQAQK